MNAQLPSPEPKLALPSPEDKRVILAWTQPKWRGIRNPNSQTGCEISDENGIFITAYATLTYRDEDPAVYTFHDAIPLPLVKVATPEQKKKFLELKAEWNRVGELIKDAERDIAANGEPVSWEWILEHGNSRESDYVPVPHHSKTALANLRKGSRVVIGVQSSAYYKIAGKVGKVVKKRSKDVIVRFGEHQYRIPYPDLKPAAQVSSEQRKANQKGSEMAAKVVEELNKMFK
jgi:hypothetical protein